jgi:hypothetical protein
VSDDILIEKGAGLTDNSISSLQIRLFRILRRPDCGASIADWRVKVHQRAEHRLHLHIDISRFSVGEFHGS